MENKLFRQEEIEAISAALGDTSDGLTGSEIGHILTVCRIGGSDSGDYKAAPHSQRTGGRPKQPRQSHRYTCLHAPGGEAGALSRESRAI